MVSLFLKFINFSFIGVVRNVNIFKQTRVILFMIEFISSNIVFVIFVMLLTLFLFVKRKNLSISGAFPIFYMIQYRTKLGLNRMDKWSKKHPKVFLYLAYLAIFVGVVGMVFMFVFMFWQLWFIVENEMSAGGGLVLPIQTDKGLEGAFPIFFVPFWYWIIAIFILATVHEFAHGVIAERFNIRVKSSGFAFLGILAPIVPAAFVEPDEKQMDRKPKWQKVAVLGAGSTSNFIFGFLFFLVWVFAAVPLVDSTMDAKSITFGSTMNESSLYGYGVTSGEIVSLNGEEDVRVILKKISNLSVNETIDLTLLEGGLVTNYSVVTFENPSVEGKGMIGITGISVDMKPKEEYEFLGSFPIGFERALFWIWFLNIAIGLMNLLPIWITDGGQIAKTLLEKNFKKETALNIYHIVSWISLVLIVFTIWPSILYGILGLF